VLLWGFVVACAQWLMSAIYLAIILMHYQGVVPYGSFLTAVRAIGDVLQFPLVDVLWFLSSRWSRALDALYVPVLFLNGGLWGAIATVIHLWVSKPRAPISHSTRD
jgi:hypothetical protein